MSEHAVLWQVTISAEKTDTELLPAAETEYSAAAEQSPRLLADAGHSRKAGLSKTGLQNGPTLQPPGNVPEPSLKIY